MPQKWFGRVGWQKECMKVYDVLFRPKIPRQLTASPAKATEVPTANAILLFSRALSRGMAAFQDFSTPNTLDTMPPFTY
jgi:hypothetical protein